MFITWILWASVWKGIPLELREHDNINPKSNELEEEAAKKAKEESACRLEAWAKKILAKEKQWEEEEEEAIQGKIAELQKAIAQEALNLELEGEDLEDYIEEQSKKNEEDLGGEDQEQSPARDNPKDPPSTFETILIGGHLPIVEMGLVAFTPSKEYDVACLEDVHFNPKMKSIVWRT